MSSFNDIETATPLVWGLTFTKTLAFLLAVAVTEGAVIFIADPWQQLSNARNAERWHDVNEIANGYYMNVTEHRGVFSCEAGAAPTELSWVQSVAGAPAFNLAPCVVPDYLVRFPHDTGSPAAYYRTVADYASGYRLMLNPATSRLIVTAPYAELGETIQVER